MKATVFGLLCVIFAATTVSVAQAQTPTASVTQIVAADADPMDTSSTDSGAADHFIDVKVQGNPITGIAIEFPPGLRVTKGIDVKARSKQTVKANVAINSNGATINFLQPVSPGTTLKIALRGVNGSRSAEDIWLYPIAVRYVGETQNIAIGTARIATYEND
ncbi:MAG: hypothetical protein KME27_09925 [Lyngbya sp. HA4199-MV5]|nr:hypothetical protein [Lyngbya sp. HA4199-MV5]